ncbi:hypothetical protein ACSF6V_10095 [Escherichia coli]|uniref:hypothetical protein n=1 Tax=Escherichia coli TaxID=562 RepID=UPI003EE9B5CE
MQAVFSSRTSTHVVHPDIRSIFSSTRSDALTCRRWTVYQLWWREFPPQVVFWR